MTLSNLCLSQDEGNTDINLVDILMARASSNPDGEACVFLKTYMGLPHVVTYEELDATAKRIAVKLQTKLIAGDRAVLLYEPGIEYITAFFGCLYAGIIAVPVYLPQLNSTDASGSSITAVISDAKARALLTTLELQPKVEAVFKTYSNSVDLCCFSTNDVSRCLDTNWTKPEIGEKNTAFIQYTSGSTAMPKGVQITHGNLMHNLAAISVGFKMNPNSRGIIWLPPYHDMGLIGGILAPIYNGFSLSLLSPKIFIKNPLHWLKIISEHGGTISGAPNFAYELCIKQMQRRPIKNLDLSTWDIAFCGAEPVRPETVDAFFDMFMPFGLKKAAFQVCYGLAETTLMITSTLFSRDRQDKVVKTKRFDADKLTIGDVVPSSNHAAQTVVSCGYVIPQHEVCIVDPDSKTRLSTDCVGEIWVNGPSVAMGYWHNAEATNHTFHARLSNQSIDANKAWLRTGDLGFLHQGELFVTGRHKDLMIIRGRNYHPQDIEKTAEHAHTLLRPYSTAAFTIDTDNSQTLVLLQEVKHHDDEVKNVKVVLAIRQAVMKAFGLSIDRLVLVKTGQIPKTTSGKIRRHLCRDLYHKHALESPTELNYFLNDPPVYSLDNLTSYVKHHLSVVSGLGEKEIDLTHTFTEIGIDSIQMVALIHKINDYYSFSINLDLLEDDMTINQLITMIDSDLKRISHDNIQPIIRTKDQVINPGQEAIYFNCLLNPLSTSNNISKVIKFTQEVNRDFLILAIETIIQRYTSLRSTFYEAGQKVYQKVHPTRLKDAILESTYHFTEAELLSNIHSDATRIFNLEKDALIKFYIYRTIKNEMVLLFVAHHIVMDYWSLIELSQALNQVYSDLVTPNSPVSNSSFDGCDPFAFTTWYTSYLNGHQYKTDWKFWSNYIKKFNLGVALKPVPNAIPKQHTFTLKADVTKAMFDFSKQHQTTPYITLLTAFNCLLYSITGEEEVMVGSPVALRNWDGAKNFIGYCVNVLPMSTTISVDLSFELLLQQIKRDTKQVFNHKNFPFSHLLRNLSLPRVANRMPFFNHLFIYQCEQVSHQDDASLFLIQGEDFQAVPGKSELLAIDLPYPDLQTDLNLVITSSKETLTCCLAYRSHLFDDAQINHIEATFKAILTRMIKTPEKSIAQMIYLPMPLPQEQHMRRVQVNDTHQEFNRDCLYLDGLFLLAAKQHGERLALVTRDKELNYAALQKLMNQLSRYLISKGAQNNELIAIIMDKGWEQVLACLGIMAAGCAYLPIDPTLPNDRVNELLSMSRVRFILTQNRLLQQCNTYEGALDCTALDVLVDEEINKYSDRALHIQRRVTDLAYVVFTSGSTGVPKGVMMEHHSVVNTILDMNTRFNVTEKDKVLGLSSLSFDLSVYDIFGILAAGATVVLPNKNELKNPDCWVSMIKDYGITIWNSVPMLMQMLVDYVMREHQSDSGLLRSLRLVLLSGDWISLSLPSAIRQCLLPQRQLKIISLGGATECAIWSIHHEIKEVLPHWKSIPYGKPLANQHFYVLDHVLQPCRDGFPGGLYIGGCGLARGYWNDEIKTKQQFVSHPETGERLYATGDLGQYLPDGSIEFLGRKDNQVKLNGYRIELDEIQFVLNQHPHIVSNIPIIFDKKNKRLIIVYVIWNVSNNTDVLIDQDYQYKTTLSLRDYVERKLPQYMLPNHYIYIDQYPLTDNGKLDRTALMDFYDEQDINVEEQALPQNDVQHILLSMWQDKLQIKHITITDNFFSLGGNSLMAVQLVSDISRTFEVDIQVETLFKFQTIQQIEGFISQSVQSKKEDCLQPLLRVPHQ